MPPLFDKLRDREEFEAILERFAEKIAEKISVPVPPERIERIVPVPPPPILEREFHYFTYPSDGTKKLLVKGGTTQIDFFTGKVTLPDGTEEMLSDSLRNHEEPFIRSFMIDVDKDVTFWLDNSGKKPIDLDDIHGETYQNFRILYLDTPRNTTFFVWACTNPEAFLRRFKPTIFRKIINEYNIAVSPVSEYGDAVVKLGYYSGTSVAYQNLATWTIPGSYYGAINEIAFTSDANALFRLTIAGTVQFADLKVVAPPSFPLPANRIGSARSVLLEVKSTGVAIEVNGAITGKEVLIS